MTNINDFINALTSRQNGSSYEVTATVIRIEDEDTAWVHIDGGVDETPCHYTASCSEGDSVRVRISNGQAWILGNETAPSTDDTTANSAIELANVAGEAAERAQESADTAAQAAEDAQNSADIAHTAADSAQASADNANEYAARALGNLSSVQSVTETLNWITQHGTMTNTQSLVPPETELNPTHVYFVLNDPPTGQTTPHGDYHVGDHYYDVVSDPKIDDISTYYVLSIDESLNNYVATHLAVDGEGLWVLPASSGSYKVLIATGTSAGTYIIDASGNTVARFGTTAQIGKDGETRAEIDYHSLQLIDGSKNPNVVYFHVSNILDSEGKLTETSTADGTRRSFVLALNPIENETTVKVDGVVITSGVRVGGDSAAVYFDEAPASGSVVTVIYTPDPYYRDANWLYAYTFGTRFSNSWLGPLSVSEGYNNKATEFCSHAEGYETYAASQYCHAEGVSTKASSPVAHAEGWRSEARGQNSHAQNCWTIAQTEAQTALGRYNVKDSNGDYAVIVGNGTADDARSNALTVDWAGNIKSGKNGTHTVSSTDISDTGHSGTMTGKFSTAVDSTAVYMNGMVQLTIYVQNTQATANGTDVFRHYLSLPDKFMPKYTVTGGSYYSKYAMMAKFNSEGELVVRNANHESFSQLTGTNNIVISLLYISKTA